LWNSTFEDVIMGIKPPLAARTLKIRVVPYILAAAAVVVALLISSALRPWVGDGVAYILLLAAIAFSAWYCGTGPSIFAVVLAMANALYGFMPPVHAFRILTRADLVTLLVFLFSSTALVIMAEFRRRHYEELRKSQGELESLVQQRTADLDAANQSLRDLSARLLKSQDEERRRIARELHDSVGQLLAALGMNLSEVRLDIERLAKTANALMDSENLVHEMTTEVRTISHLLHPPLLDEAGLCSALRWYGDGFALRSKIKVDLDLPKDFNRLPRESETAIFRVIQECLTNIHRHSESPIARIRLWQRDDHVMVEIEDEGKGIPPEKQIEMASGGTPGVGIRGMRERLRQLGGALEINSSESGTVIVVQLPISETSTPESPVQVSNPSPAAA
jgi:signal transduction histidine kinase